MKRLPGILQTMLLIILINPGSISQEDWQLKYPLITNRSLSEVFFFSEEKGFAIGQGVILSTSNAGADWQAEYLDEVISLNDIYFSDDLTGYIVGEGGYMLKTTDGGESWFEIPSGVNTGLNSVYFVNNDFGFVAGDKGVILKSGDGGLSWDSCNSNTYEELFCVFFIDGNTGFAAGGNGYNNEGIVLKTTDAGKNWMIKSSGKMGSINSVHFNAQGVGVACGGVGGSTSGILRSADYGDTWTVQYKENGYLQAVEFINDTLAYISGEYLFRSTDGGLNWGALSNLQIWQSWGMDFVDENTGFVAGSPTSLLKTTDGGLNWEDLNGNNHLSLKSVHFADPMTGYVAGLSGSLFMTNNGGEEWDNLSFIPNGRMYFFYDIFAVDPVRAYAVGLCRNLSNNKDTGMVIRTGDAGENWNILALFNTFLPDRVLFTKDSKGYISGNRPMAISPFLIDGVVLETSDGGTTWDTILHLNNSKLIDLCFPTDEVGFCLADSALTVYTRKPVIYKTQDEGATWDRVEVPYTGAMSSFSFNDPEHGCICGDSGIVLLTSDGGVNWEKVHAGNKPLYSCQFTDADTGYAVGKNGCIYKTIDGGYHWGSQASMNICDNNSVFFLNGLTGFVAGNIGTIMKTTTGGGAISTGIRVKAPLRSTVEVYPNPNNGLITLAYDLTESTQTFAEVLDLTGKAIFRSDQRFQGPGEHEIRIDLTGLPAGIFIYRLHLNDRVISGKLILVP